MSNEDINNRLNDLRKIFEVERWDFGGDNDFDDSVANDLEETAQKIRKFSSRYRFSLEEAACLGLEEALKQPFFTMDPVLNEDRVVTDISVLVSLGTNSDYSIDFSLSKMAEQCVDLCSEHHRIAMAGILRELATRFDGGEK